MKKHLTILAMAFATTVAFTPRAANAAAEISAGIEIHASADFTAPLTPLGSWVDYKSYGRCWRPAHVESDWRPYTVGYWEWTDAGWYWESDEPFAWACYHYGSWDYDSSVGWVWIPGTDWSPAWVTWRDSDDYIGWAPCGQGLAVLAPSFFSFCDVHHFRDHFRPNELIVNNRTIIDRTRVVKDFHRESMDFNGGKRTVFTNKGPGVDPIERATGTKFEARPIRDVVRESPRPENARPEQRPGEERHDATPSPTGREQERNYQQPQQKAPETPRERPDVNPPTGRDQQHIYQEPGQKTPAAPKERPDVNPPTGRDQPRIYHDVPNPTPPAEQKHEVPMPPERSVTPPERPAAPSAAERPLPPTGREEAPRAVRPAPPVETPHPAPVAPQGGDGHDGGRDGHRPDGGQ